ncbi:hypothetical protein LPA44_05895 [Halobacterium sp. KA-4]|uniref:hypothetical protein n=1 Tax=Halobacterium sp. KA-4 TaxID=2896367 RepID=UPI001E5FBFC9|nr:hypothetical protein [Halobacterium sp. KA-4]MCD2199429.1 hypothetical protein [Halobacterium sp. KA-4]
MTERLPQELREKHGVFDVVFLAVIPDISKQHCSELGSDSKPFVVGLGIPSNISL